MRYTYYPGCSLESTSKAYDRSLRTVFRLLGHQLEELEDWNCCGSTAYTSVAETMALAVCARNLALAERRGGDLVAPCSACYTVLKKTDRFLREQPELRRRVGEALAAAGLSYGGGLRIRHPLDVMANDIGLDAIAAKVTRRLEGLRVAPYYGCQIVRPEQGFDDREVPMVLDQLFERLGATVVDYPMKVRCCGGMLMTTVDEVGLRLCHELLASAVESGAEVIATTCPLCQINLEAYQGVISRRFRTRIRMPVVFFTQLVGLALGAGPEELGLDLHLVPFEPVAASLAEAAHV
jgi:heterodisulfide reductase subunit B2